MRGRWPKNRGVTDWFPELKKVVASAPAFRMLGQMQQVLIFMTDYSSPRFKTSAVAEAAGVSHATLRSYFKRGQWRVIGKKAEGEGLPNLFSLRDALVFAVAARLIEATSASPEEAFHCAVHDFAHVGTSDRQPARMFNLHERGETLLIYDPDKKRGRIKASDDVVSLSDIIRANGNPSSAPTIVVLNPVAARVFRLLGIAGAPWDVGLPKDDESGEFIAE